MNTKDKPTIMRDSPEAAQLVTVTGWRSSKGRFFGDDESTARYDGATHQKCACGQVYEIQAYCRPCHERHVEDEWLKLPLVEWDGESMIAVYDGDDYFSDPDEFLEWCIDNNHKPEFVRLVLCEPEYFSPVDTDYWCDNLPEDGDIPDVIAEAMAELNKAIKAYGKPSCWRPGKQRIIIKGDET